MTDTGDESEWTDVTSLFRTAASGMACGKMIMIPGFKCERAISAFQLNDSRMDPYAQDGIPLPDPSLLLRRPHETPEANTPQDSSAITTLSEDVSSLFKPNPYPSASVPIELKEALSPKRIPHFLPHSDNPFPLYRYYDVHFNRLPNDHQHMRAALTPHLSSELPTNESSSSSSTSSSSSPSTSEESVKLNDTNLDSCRPLTQGDIDALSTEVKENPDYLEHVRHHLHSSTSSSTISHPDRQASVPLLSKLAETPLRYAKDPVSYLSSPFTRLNMLQTLELMDAIVSLEDALQKGSALQNTLFACLLLHLDLPRFINKDVKSDTSSSSSSPSSSSSSSSSFTRPTSFSPEFDFYALSHDLLVSYLIAVLRSTDASMEVVASVNLYGSDEWTNFKSGLSLANQISVEDAIKLLLQQEQLVSERITVINQAMGKQNKRKRKAGNATSNDTTIAGANSSTGEGDGTSSTSSSNSTSSSPASSSTTMTSLAGNLVPPSSLPSTAPLSEYFVGLEEMPLALQAALCNCIAVRLRYRRNVLTMRGYFNQPYSVGLHTGLKHARLAITDLSSITNTSSANYSKFLPLGMRTQTTLETTSDSSLPSSSPSSSPQPLLSHWLTGRMFHGTLSMKTTPSSSSSPSTSSTLPTLSPSSYLDTVPTMTTSTASALPMENSVRSIPFVFPADAYTTQLKNLVGMVRVLHEFDIASTSSPPPSSSSTTTTQPLIAPVQATSPSSSLSSTDSSPFPSTGVWPPGLIRAVVASFASESPERIAIETPGPLPDLDTVLDTSTDTKNNTVSPTTSVSSTPAVKSPTFLVRPHNTTLSTSIPLPQEGVNAPSRRLHVEELIEIALGMRWLDLDILTRSHIMALMSDDARFLGSSSLLLLSNAYARRIAPGVTGWIDIDASSSPHASQMSILCRAAVIELIMFCLDKPSRAMKRSFTTLGTLGQRVVYATTCDDAVVLECKKQGIPLEPPIPVPEGIMPILPHKHPFFAVHFELLSSELIRYLLTGFETKLYQPAELYYVYANIEYIATYRMNNRLLAARRPVALGSPSSGPGYERKHAVGKLTPKQLKSYLNNPDMKQPYPPLSRDLSLTNIIANMCKGILCSLLAIRRAFDCLPVLPFVSSPDLFTTWYIQRFRVFAEFPHPRLPNINQIAGKIDELLQAPLKNLITEAMTSWKMAKMACSQFMELYAPKSQTQQQQLAVASATSSPEYPPSIYDEWTSRVLRLQRIIDGNTKALLPVLTTKTLPEKYTRFTPTQILPEETALSPPTKKVDFDWSIDPWFPIITVVDKKPKC